MLCLLPSEEAGMKKLLEDGRIPVKKLLINLTKTVILSQKRVVSLHPNSKPDLNALTQDDFDDTLVMKKRHDSASSTP